MGLAPQRDTRVTEEIRNPMGWIVGRTQRLARLAALPEVQEIVQQVVTHLDSFCAVEAVEPDELQGNVLPTRALRYITIRLGARPCWACNGSGVQKGAQIAQCTACEGTGVR